MSASSSDASIKCNGEALNCFRAIMPWRFANVQRAEADAGAQYAFQ
jgi:hypothetical protein